MAIILQVLMHTMLLILSATLCSAATIPEQHVLADTTITATLRDATWADLDGIVRVGLDAFSHGPAFSYTNPGYEQYKDYTRYCTRERIKTIFKDGIPEGIFIKVITVPRTESGSYHVTEDEEIVAFAGWQLRIKGEDSAASSLQDLAFLLTASNSSPVHRVGNGHEYDCSLRLGSNITRSEHHQRQLTEAHEKYIESQFDSYFYLAALATHPTWDGHNFGALNLKWGQGFAKEKNLPITLLSTPAGYPLYRSVGFQNLHNATFEMLDGLGYIWYEAMKYDPA